MIPYPDEEKITWEFAPGEKTAALFASPSDAAEHIVLLVHGFMSSKNSDTNRTLTALLLEQGIASLRFDLFGHGESDGPFTQLTLSRCLRQVDGVMNWIKTKGYKKISMVGSSFGGLIGIHTASQYTHLNALALRCPVSHYPRIWQDRLGPAGIARWKEDEMLSFVTEDGRARLAYSFYHDLLQHDTYTAASHIKTPTLIVHGDADSDVPVDQSIRLFDTLRLKTEDKRFIQMPGADHGFSKPDDFSAMIQQIMTWITSPH